MIISKGLSVLGAYVQHTNSVGTTLSTIKGGIDIGLSLLPDDKRRQLGLPVSTTSFMVDKTLQAIDVIFGGDDSE